MRARTVRLDADRAELDLVALAGEDGVLFAREGAGFAGRGQALRIDLPDGVAGSYDAVGEALAAIEVDDDLGLPGTGPVALGALPFDPDAPGSLVVPELLVGVAADGTAWLTTVTTHPLPRVSTGTVPVEMKDEGPWGASPDGFNLTSGPAHDEWCALVADAVEVIRRGELEKVVLAREVHVHANRPIVRSAVLARLRALYPSCMVFNMGGFLGASPELLVSRIGRAVRSHPLAGTIPHSGDPEVDARMARALLSSAKERHEHRVVIDAVAEALAEVCSALDVPDGPSIVPLRNVSHLGTLLTGTLAEPAVDALALVARLHPTPAVGGVPTKEALAYIAAAEPFDRGLYAGAVGWMDGRGDGEWAVGIRSATVEGDRARLVAGDGIVGDSDPDAELAETQLKLQALLSAVVRP
ncbi:MAG TPA: isochorismate synthase [Acidimicrobiales bacterium]|jgi:menaquinone-specific isochorismate synthase|nr:isochorismate synthase [Acidimicrobiales bacterium]